MRYINFRIGQLTLLAKKMSGVRIYLFYLGISIGGVLWYFEKLDIFILILFTLLIFVFIDFKLIFTLLGLVLFLIFSYSQQEIINNHKNNFSKDVSLEVMVLEDGESKEYNQQMVVTSDELGGKILITANKYPKYYAGDILKVDGKLEQIENFDESFDYKTYLYSQGIYSKIDYANLEYEEDRQILSIHSIGSEIRRSIIRFSRSVFLEPESSLFTGLVVGSASGFNAELEQDMKYSGTTHLVVVSGSNFALLMFLLFKLSGYIGRRRVYVLSPVVLLMYLVVVGVGNVPAYRAMIMATISIIGLYFGRRSAIWNSILITVAILFLENNYVVFDASFQLSFAALIGIISLNKRFDVVLTKMNSSLREIVSTTISASIATTPISIITFGGISLVSLASNLLLVPMIGFISMVSIIVSVISFVVNEFAIWLAFPIKYYLELINTLIKTFSAEGYFYTDNRLVLALFIIFIIFLTLYADWKYHLKTSN